MPPRLPLRQISCTRYEEEIAQNAYPELDRHEAFNENIKKNRPQGYFFLNDEGERCIWRPDVDYYRQDYYEFKNFYEILVSGGTKYWFRRKKRVLVVVDKPKAENLTAMIAHPSERGWNLPNDQERHLLNLPLDTRLVILDHVLAVDKTEFIAPYVVTSNSKRFYREPTFEVHDMTNGAYITGNPSVISHRHIDGDGDYVELRQVYFRAIDASVLRVCKQIYGEGIALLYGQNTFAFKMINKHYHHSPPSCSRHRVEHRPNARKPGLKHWDGAITHVMPKIAKHSHVNGLPGWVYYDPFLRFLWIITPSNAAILRSITLTGHVKIHHCHPNVHGYGGCADDIIKSIKLYIPFFNKFCTGLRHLTIQATEDLPEHGQPYPLHPGDPVNRDDALQPFLQNELRNIIILDKLESIDENRHPLDIAKATIEWFNNRANERARAEAEAKQALRMEAPNLPATAPQCEFCGGGHVWAECWDLCNVCGAYGHYRSTCPELQH